MNLHYHTSIDHILLNAIGTLVVWKMAEIGAAALISRGGRLASAGKVIAAVLPGQAVAA